MCKRVSRICAVGIAVSLANPTAVLSQTTTIDFEGLAVDELVTNQFAASGVTFENVFASVAGVSLNEIDFPPSSGQTVVSGFPASPAVIHISPPMPVVSLNITAANVATVSVFDDFDVFLDSVEVGPNLGGTINVEFITRQLIGRVEIVGQMGARFLTLDDVSLSTEIPNDPPIANAGDDQALECTNFLTDTMLNGSDSTDADEDLLTYNWTGPFGAAMGVSPTVQLALGTFEITLTVDDGNGGVDGDSVNVTVQDTTAPTVDAGPDVMVEATAMGGAAFELQSVASDACSAVSIMESPVPALYPLGATLVSVTATDGSDNISSDTVTITVVDTTPPELTVPPDVAVEADAEFTAVVIGEATATDIFPVTIGDDAPTTFPLGRCSDHLPSRCYDRQLDCHGQQWQRCDRHTASQRDRYNCTATRPFSFTDDAVATKSQDDSDRRDGNCF